MDLDERDASPASARQARARQLRRKHPIHLTSEVPGHATDRPILDMTRPRLRLFARSGEFPRADEDDVITLD